MQASNGKTLSTNQRSSPNIYELESSISKVAFESSISKVAFESSVSLDTEGSKTPGVTTPSYGFAFNMSMRHLQGDTGELKL